MKKNYSLNTLIEYLRVFKEVSLLKIKDVPDHIDRSIDRSKSLDRLIDRSTSNLRSIISFILKTIKELKVCIYVQYINQ
jgi:Mg2+ and Co2+ transporter CorA